MTNDPTPPIAETPSPPVAAPAPTVSLPPTPGRRPEGESVLTVDLDPRRMPFLSDHRIDHRAVLPFAMMLEWGAEAALHRHPGLQIRSLENWRVLKGVVLPSAGISTIEFIVSPPIADEDRVRVEVSVVGRDERQTLHARGFVTLAPSSTPPPLAADPPPLGPDPRTSVEAYTEHLFHGPTLRTIERIIGSSEAGIAALCTPAPDPRTWLPAPRRRRWVLDPLLIDAAFQLQILWAIRQVGSPCLPCFVESLEIYEGPPLGDSSLVRVTIVERGEHGARTSIEIHDRDGDPRFRLRGAECVIDPSLERAFRATRAGSSS